jgi:hypothetical protein
MPRVPGVAHVILIAEDDGSPSLTSYRRAILEIAPADGAAAERPGLQRNDTAPVTGH